MIKLEVQYLRVSTYTSEKTGQTYPSVHFLLKGREYKASCTGSVYESLNGLGTEIKGVELGFNLDEPAYRTQKPELKCVEVVTVPKS